MTMISVNSKVTMHFSLKLMDGSAADSTKVNGKPATVTMGDGTLSDAMEAQLMGLKPGDKKTFILKPEDGVGMPNTHNIHVMARQDFPGDIQLEEGLIISFTQPNGAEYPGIIRVIDGDNITVDFNHPLAGQSLIIDVDIIAVE
jgi:FKBP-type peptidyl-prolyl cis-trans isomerase SlpA